MQAREAQEDVLGKVQACSYLGTDHAAGANPLARFFTVPTSIELVFSDRLILEPFPAFVEPFDEIAFATIN
jgi:hypothetical protein